MDSDGPNPPQPRSRRSRRVRRLVPALIGLAIVAAIFGFALPKIASYRAVLDVVSGLTWEWWLALAGAVVLNVLTFAPPWAVALPGLGFRRALVLTQASTAVSSVLPGGEAVGLGLSMGMMRSWGFPAEALTAAIAIVGGLNIVAKVVLPAVAVILVLATGGGGGLLAILSAIGIVIVTGLLVAVALTLRDESSTLRLGLRIDRLFTWARGLFRRGASAAVGTRLVQFRRELVVVLRRRWLSLSVWTLIGHLSVFVVLLVSARAVGISSDEVHTVDLFAGWALTRLLTAVPITPGGLGIVELGLTGALLAAGGDQEEVVAAVLLFRALTWLQTIVLGAISALVWRRVGRKTPVPGAQAP